VSQEELEEERAFTEVSGGSQASLTPAPQKLHLVRNTAVAKAGGAMLPPNSREPSGSSRKRNIPSRSRGSRSAVKHEF
jgi:hypothetical protein